MPDLSANPDLLDRIIAVVIVLFILSVITEKFTNLVRSYPRHFRVLLLLFCLMLVVVSAFTMGSGDRLDVMPLIVLAVIIAVWVLANDTIFQPHDKPEKQWRQKLQVLSHVAKGQAAADGVKEREVSVLSFIVGFFVAVSFKVHLITLLDEKDKWGWGNEEIFKTNKLLVLKYIPWGGPFFYDLFGFLLTAFFLAFGSKFFHDLLDNLLQVKNLKRKMNDRETYQVTSIKEFDDHLAQETFDQNVEALMETAGVSGVSFGKVNYEGAFRFGMRIYSDTPEALQNSPHMQDRNGKPVPVEIRSPESAVVCSVTPSMPLKNNQRGELEKGTVCLAVCERGHEEKPYLLTCYHVVKHAVHAWEYFIRAGGEEDTVRINNTIEGFIARGIRTPQLDIALVSWNDREHPVTNVVPDFNTPITKSRPVYSFDDDATPVQLYGAQTRERKNGLITGVKAHCMINFNDGLPRFGLSNLMEIQHNGQTIVQGGDSGVLVFTSEGVALGMVVATTPTRTLAIPIHSILSTWKLKLYPNP